MKRLAVQQMRAERQFRKEQRQAVKRSKLIRKHSNEIHKKILKTIKKKKLHFKLQEEPNTILLDISYSIFSGNAKTTKEFSFNYWNAHSLKQVKAVFEELKAFVKKAPVINEEYEFS